MNGTVRGKKKLEKLGQNYELKNFKYMKFDSIKGSFITYKLMWNINVLLWFSIISHLSYSNCKYLLYQINISGFNMIRPSSSVASPRQLFDTRFLSAQRHHDLPLTQKHHPDALQFHTLRTTVIWSSIKHIWSMQYLLQFPPRGFPRHNCCKLHLCFHNNPKPFLTHIVIHNWVPFFHWFKGTVLH